MLERRATVGPYWEKPVPDDERLAQQVEHGREEHLLLDARPPAELNQITLATMRQTGPRFWMAVAGLGVLTVAFFIVWAIQIFSGLGVTGLNRSVMW